MDVATRLEQHNSKFHKNASTKTSNDWKLFWSLKCQSRKQAIKIENHVKRMRNKTYYHNLKKYPEIAEKLLIKFL